MPLFYFSNSSDEERSRDALQNHFGMKNRYLLDDLSQWNMPYQTEVAEPIVILGHSEILEDSSVKIGGLTAEQMAQQFAAKIPFKVRNSVEDLYLLACEAGWPGREKSDYRKRNSCFAKDFGDELAKLGFKRVNIHSVMPKEIPNSKVIGMYFEIQPSILNTPATFSSMFITKEFEEIEKRYKGNDRILMDKYENSKVERTQTKTKQTSQGSSSQTSSTNRNNRLENQKRREQANEDKKKLDQLKEHNKIFCTEKLKDWLDKPEYSYQPNTQKILDSNKKTVVNPQRNFKSPKPLPLLKAENYYKYGNSNRWHFFTLLRATTKNPQYSNHIGDALKLAVLKELESSIDEFQDRESLRKYLDESKEYKSKVKIIDKGQGITTRLFGLNTSSKKALNRIIQNKYKALANIERDAGDWSQAMNSKKT